MTSIKLTDEQSSAIARMRLWLDTTRESFFLLKGSAGTGKTLCISDLATAGGRFAFTAPTNKATKVLKDSVTTDTYKPLCKTIYSLLGLTLGTDGEVKELKGGKSKVMLSSYDAIVVDEASLISKELFAHIETAAIMHNARFLFMGDPAQLPPINEKSSRVWEIGSAAMLTRVMRHDNEILALATKIREEVDKAEPNTRLAAANDGVEGVWKLDRGAFEAQIKEDAIAGLFSLQNNCKVIAWRNKRVDAFNKLIRGAIFNDPLTPKWTAGDRVLFASAIKDHEERVIASIDDEGTVVETDIEIYNGLKAWILTVQLDDEEGTIVEAIALHEDAVEAYTSKLRVLADDARSKKTRWHSYWAFKELFHEVKYAYAITAHRAQGSTYETAYVCWQDILRNSNVNEAYRCLYVAATRPKKRLILS